MNEIIYKILKEKSINDHYLKRYIKFIEKCIDKNKNLSDNTIYEKHHICPAGKTFFPEYKSFKLNPWNLAYLTPRQHFIAHWILAKALSKGMWFAFIRMCGVNSKNNKRNYNVSSKIYEIARKNYSENGITKEQIEKSRLSKIGKTLFKNENGELFYLNINDPRILEENLVGHTKGSTFDGYKLKNKVSCIDTETGNYIKIDKENFDLNDRYVGVNSGKESSTKDRIWIKKNDKHKMIYAYELEEYLNDSWVIEGPHKGQQKDYIKNSVWMNNGIENVRCFSEECAYYESIGYKMGRKKGFKQKKIREIVKCHYCGKEGKKSSAMIRFHFENCKSKQINTPAV